MAQNWDVSPWKNVKKVDPYVMFFTFRKFHIWLNPMPVVFFLSQSYFSLSFAPPLSIFLHSSLHSISRKNLNITFFINIFIIPLLIYKLRIFADKEKDAKTCIENEEKRIFIGSNHFYKYFYLIIEIGFGIFSPSF